MIMCILNVCVIVCVAFVFSFKTEPRMIVLHVGVLQSDIYFIGVALF